MKLSKVQRDVLDKMATSWKLGMSHAFGVRCWLQKGHIGEGGESQNIKCSTLNTLFKRGLIKQGGRRHSMMTFKLTDEGIK